MLSAPLDVLLKMSETTSPQKLRPSDCITLYQVGFPGYSFCGDVVLDTVSMASRNEVSILYQFKTQSYVVEFCSYLYVYFVSYTWSKMLSSSHDAIISKTVLIRLHQTVQKEINPILYNLFPDIPKCFY